MDDASLEIGTLIAERYAVEQLVGLGGLAEVYRVRHLELGSVHALKLLTWNRKSLTERLLLEGRIQAQLQHPHIVRVTDVVRIDRRVGLLLEFIEGPSLDEFLDHHGALSVPDALGLFAPVLAAVAHAHDAGVLHRDMKPANVLLGRAPGGWVPKVTDFGLAKVVEEGLGSNTRTGISMGTPGYMPPEQVRNSASADVRTDVFALGATLYELIAGRKAFQPPDGSEIELTATIDRTPEPLTAINPAVWEAIQRSVSPDREHRFPDVRSFAQALGVGDHPSLSAAPDLVPVPLALDPSTYPSNPSGAPPASGPPAQPTLGPVDGANDGARTAGPWVVAALLGSVLIAVGVVAVMTQPVIRSRQAREIERQLETDPAPAPPEPVLAFPPVERPAPATPAAPEPVPTEPVPPEPVPGPTEPPSPVPEPEAFPEDPVESPEPQVIEVLEPLPSVLVDEAGGEADDGPQNAAFEEVPAGPSDPPTDDEPPAEEEEDLGPTLPLGTWKGEASARPFELRVQDSSGGRVSAQAVFITGSALPRIVPLEGQFDLASGELLLTSSSARLAFNGRRAGNTIQGEYTRGNKSLPFRVSLD